MSNFIGLVKSFRILRPPFLSLRIARQIAFALAASVGNEPRGRIDLGMTRFRPSIIPPLVQARWHERRHWWCRWSFGWPDWRQGIGSPAATPAVMAERLRHISWPILPEKASNSATAWSAVATPYIWLRLLAMALRSFQTQKFREWRAKCTIQGEGWHPGLHRDIGEGFHHWTGKAFKAIHDGNKNVPHASVIYKKRAQGVIAFLCIWE